MQTAELGDRVVIHYIGTLDNGRIFDSRDGDDGLEITLGQEEVFPALEAQLVGMHEGEVKNIIVPAEEAYGRRLEENILKLERGAFPPDKELRIGQKLSLQFKDGQERVMLITALDETQVTLDGNHVLAGCQLTFALKLEKIISAQ